MKLSRWTEGASQPIEPRKADHSASRQNVEHQYLQAEFTFCCPLIPGTRSRDDRRYHSVWSDFAENGFSVSEGAWPSWFRVNRHDGAHPNDRSRRSIPGENPPCDAR